ncbi:3-phenylpropionate/trans-cinnamate dioxygenase ferredoxin reductase subunit [Litoreibacter ponti]|uniref:3-phenylpropionate/trans-cinnamate dioxygenase ferredoxin reductase subunit n=1 Tax=Litoreibacter ponti TaxID=1510457 RepID=A0A2T6BPU2_9RHOB|nr:FAD/NAD(P)-binding oxidoreductase [Litoreibacter ponti]PTX58081.1 3-phenylpropionate/trans-cinnamate dioxygenase ferredoxin reductase subunit [Litoreibacter ponti]
MSHIVVIGAGQAGASLTAKLRASGFDGEITLIGAESEPPYQRPPLSKGYLLGEMQKERLYLRPEHFYTDQKITLLLGEPVSKIDPSAKTVQVGDKVISYDQLALTTGSTPRHLPKGCGGDLHGVYAVRSLDDVDQMAPEFVEGRRALIVGGGYIGLEAAAVAAKMGVEVTLVEMSERILQRVAAAETSDFFRDLHRDHGVKIVEGVGLKHLLGDTQVTGARLTDESELQVDFVIVGVGVAPSDFLAVEAGLKISNGIETDAQGRTSDPSIWAAGDCASFPWQGKRIRLESVQNAIDQAELVAENMLGAGKDYDPKPWFWSDQYDVKLQIAGLNTGYSRIVTRQTGEAVSYWYYCGDRLVAVDAMNDPRNYMIGKRLIEAGKSPAPELVEDAEIDLKALLK